MVTDISPITTHPRPDSISALVTELFLFHQEPCSVSLRRVGSPGFLFTLIE